jgi:probable F420-dependent oxidoreductase
MKFWQSVAFTPHEHLAPIARAAEAAGFEGLLLSEHLFVPEAYKAGYPYSESGRPDFDARSPFPDPWVTMTALAAATTRLRFATMVYILPLRHPLEVAKAVASASIFSDGRVVLGAGAGWMREEFDVLGVDFATRGKRFDECIEVLRRVWRGGMVEFHGECFDFDRLQMSPAPPHPIPIYIGGASKPALRRAAGLGDGWLGAGNTPDQAAAILAELQQLRKQAGRSKEPFDSIVPLVTPPELGTLRRLADVGATGTVSYPFAYSVGPEATLAQKIDVMRDFEDRIIRPMQQC